MISCYLTRKTPRISNPRSTRHAGLLSLSHLFDRGLQLLTHCLFPAICLICGQRGQDGIDLCLTCQASLCHALTIPACQRCREPLPTQEAPYCGTCLQHPPAFDYTYGLAYYAQPMMHCILALKFNQQLIYARMLGTLLARVIRKHWYSKQPLPQVIIPMPLHPARLKERGFNQSIEIARPISQALNLPMDLTGVKRSKPTVTQNTLSAKQRYHNLKDAFQANRNYTGLHVAIVEDVVTTGNTVQACALSLKTKQAARIDIWCLAKCSLRY